MENIYADRTISITEFKTSPAKKVSEAQGRPVAVLVNNRPEFYAVPSELFEKIADLMDDIAIAETVKEREEMGGFISVSLDEL